MRKRLTKIDKKIHKTQKSLQFTAKSDIMLLATQLKGVYTMSIRLSSEVKSLIKEMVSTIGEYELEMLNSLVLFNVLLTNQFFSDLCGTSSKCEAEHIIDCSEKMMDSKQFNEEEVKTEKEKTIFDACLTEAEVEVENQQEIHYSQSLADVFAYAALMVQDEKRAEVTWEDIVISFMENMSDEMKELLGYYGTNIATLKENFESAIAVTESETFVIPPSLLGCVRILNLKFMNGEPSEILGRDKECQEIWRTMMKKTKRNVILIGRPGVGKSSIVYKITSDIVNGKCPQQFNGYIVLELDVNNLIAGTTLRGQAEARYADLTNLINIYNNLILFIDEVHMIIGAGAASGEKLDFSNALKPILAGDRAIVIGATTDEEYAQTFGMEGALKRRFHNVVVKEPKTTEVYDMLRESIKQLEAFHGVKISKKMVEMIIFYSSCFNYNTSNPDRTKDLIDLAMVTAKMNGKERVDRDCIMKNFGANFEEFHKMPKAMVQETAYHEVGHFVVSRFSGRLVDEDTTAISIIPAEGYLGVNALDATNITPNTDRGYFIDKIASLLAGRIAEQMFMKSTNNSGASNDLERATKIAYDMVARYGMTKRIGNNQIFLNEKRYQMQTPEVTTKINKEVQNIIEEAQARATQILQDNSELVRELERELESKGLMSKKELDTIIQKHQESQTVTV